MTRQIVLIAAMAANRVIGVDSRLPWQIPADLRHFKALTMGADGGGRPMVMGRKTFESLPGLLPGRRHIVLTRDTSWSAPGAEVAHDLDSALALAANAPEITAPEITIVGCAEIYALALPRATRIELTEVHAEVAGDTTMPPFGPGWREIAREEHEPQGATPGFAFVTLARDL